MGPAPSREIGRIVLAASRGGGIGDLMHNADFINKFNEYWLEAPKEIQAFFRGLVAKSRIWTSATLSATIYKIPEVVEANLEAWEQDPKIFFDRGTLGGDVTSLFRYIEILESSSILDTLRRRVALIAVHNLKEQLGTKNVTSHLPNLHVGMQASEEQCKRWAEWGARYKSYASHFQNNGVVFVLDFKIPKTQYERFLPVTGEGRDFFLELQEKRQIHEAAVKCARAANEILKYANSIALAAFETINPLPSQSHWPTSIYEQEKGTRKRKARKSGHDTRRGKRAKQLTVRLAGTDIWSITGHYDAPLEGAASGAPRASNASDEATTAIDRFPLHHDRHHSAPDHLDCSGGIGQPDDPISSNRQAHGTMLQSTDASNEIRSTPCSTGIIPDTMNPTVTDGNAHYVPIVAQRQEQELATSFNPSQMADPQPNRNHFRLQSNERDARQEPVERDEQNGDIGNSNDSESSEAAFGMAVLAHAATQAASSRNNVHSGTRAHLYEPDPTHPDVHQPSNVPRLGLHHSQHHLMGSDKEAALRATHNGGEAMGPLTSNRNIWGLVEGINMSEQARMQQTTAGMHVAAESSFQLPDFSQADAERIDVIREDYGGIRQENARFEFDWSDLIDLGNYNTSNGPASLV